MSNNNQQSDTVTQKNDVDISKIYVFKFLVDHGHEVPIWRKVEVPDNYSFYDLHVAVQDSMGWSDRRLHAFYMRNPTTNRMKNIGTPYDSMSSEYVVLEKTALIVDYFTLSNPLCKYEYDFAQPWDFLITLEEIMPVNPDHKYPRCVAGNCHSPPEDCPFDPSDMSWVQIPFDIESIVFRDPAVTYEYAFQGF